MPLTGRILERAFGMKKVLTTMVPFPWSPPGAIFSANPVLRTSLDMEKSVASKLCL